MGEIDLNKTPVVVPQMMSDKPRECRRCGRCCKTLAKIWVNNPATKEFIAARGLEIVDENSKVLLVLIPHFCPQLDTRRTNECKLHAQGTKPRVCRINPEASLDDFRTAALDIRKTLGPNCPWREESV